MGLGLGCSPRRTYSPFAAERIRLEKPYAHLTGLLVVSGTLAAAGPRLAASADKGESLLGVTFVQ